MDHTVVIVGAGFSVAAGLPVTSKIIEQFLSYGGPDDAEVTGALKKFRETVFGIAPKSPPSFEDYFTMLDSAANTGHNLGATYTPAMLRAIRRLSIHRVLQILNDQYAHSPHIEAMLARLASGRENTIVSTNWDIVVEKHICTNPPGTACDYGRTTNREPSESSTRLKLLKLHGSANWGYCDTCRGVQVVGPGKGLLHSGVFLREEDFKRLDITWSPHLVRSTPPPCRICCSTLSARMATFSFSKALGFFQFQSVWDEARTALMKANRWIFIGYSLPDADFEIRSLLKTAQLASQSNGGDGPYIACVLKDDKASKMRFRRFFGDRIKRIYTDGLEAWWESQADHLGHEIA
ncbi:MAG TPA: hypothetical protein PKA37_08655 [Planctomycetota bacterium]|nr:hypothetical protein [Planctomycetota bacterium]